MSRKQEIYSEILRLCIPVARNNLTRFVLYGKAKKEAYQLCELSHNLYLSILEPEFKSHDIWFLNWQARRFCEERKDIPAHNELARLISELFLLVPEHLRGELEWTGPHPTSS